MNRRIPTAVLAAALLLGPTAAVRSSQDNPKPLAAPDLRGLHDFDTQIGKWKTHHRRLKERLAGSHEWVDFDGTQTWEINWTTDFQRVS